MPEAITTKAGRWAGRVIDGFRVFLVLAAVALGVGLAQKIVIGIHQLAYPPPKPPRAQSRPEPDAIDRIARAAKHVSPDGRIYLHTTTAGRLTDSGKDELEVRDTTDALVYSGEAEGYSSRHLQFTGQRTGEMVTYLWLAARSAVQVDFSKTMVVPVLRRDRPKIVERWRYDPEAGVFVGYDEGGGLLGYLGADGVTPSAGQAQSLGLMLMANVWIPYDRLSPIVMWRTHLGLFEIDFERRSVHRHVVDFVHSVEWAMWGMQPDLADRPLVYVRVDEDTHKLLLRDPAQEIVVEIPEAWRAEDGPFGEDIMFAVAGDNVFLQRHSNDLPPRPDSNDPDVINAWLKSWTNRTRHPWMEVYRVDPAGELALIDRCEWTVRARITPKRVEQEPGLLPTAILSVSPPMYRHYQSWYGSRRGPEWSIWQILAEGTNEVMPNKPLLNYLVGLVFAALAAWHLWARRTSWAAFIAWLLLVAAFALPGLLTYLALNHTPVIRCATCGKKRGLGRADCRACGAPLPTPEPKTCDQTLLRPVAAA